MKLSGSSQNPKRSSKALEEFKSITQANDKIAQKFLDSNNWNVEAAINDYFSQGSFAAPVSKENDKLFDFYKNKNSEDDEGDIIHLNGLLKLIDDLKMDPMSVEVLVLLWKLGASTRFQVSRQEWNESLAESKIVGLSDLKKRIPSWSAELNQPDNFKDFYTWCFMYTKPKESKVISNADAVATWGLVLKGRCKFLEKWCTYVEKVHKIAIGKDTWDLFLPFLLSVDENFGGYDENSAWPVLFDQFVNWCKEGCKMTKPAAKKDEDEDD